MPEIINTTIDTPKGEVEFKIDRMPVSEENFYAVYCTYGGRDYCFHLMYENESLEFKVIDNINCPKELQDLAYLLSRAIEHYHA